MSDITPTQPWQSDLQAAQRRRQLAQALMQNVMTPTQGQMIGRYYVGGGIGDGLAKMGQALLARSYNNQADQTEQGAISAQQAAKQKAMGDFLSAIKPQQQTEMVPTGNMLPGHDTGSGTTMPMGAAPGAISMGAPTASYSYPETQAKTSMARPTPQQLGAALIQAKSAGLDVSPDMIKLLNPEPTKVGQGETLLGADNKPIFSNPKVPDGMMANPDGTFGWMPNYIGGKVQIAQAGRPTTNVNVSTGKYNNALAEAQGKGDAEMLGGLRDNARAATQALNTLGSLEGLSDKVFSGAGANTKLGLEKWFGGLGIPMSQQAINSENFKSIAGDLVLKQIKMLGANPTDSDRRFIEELVPQLESNSSARLKLIQYLKQRAQSSIKDYQDATTYAQKNGSLSGFIGGAMQASGASGNEFDK